MNIRLSALLCTLVLSLSSCAQYSNNNVDFDALLWEAASAEYDVVVEQIYSQAQSKLDHLIQDDQGSPAALEQEKPYANLPLAVIVGVDDAVLSNDALYYQLLAKKETFNRERWTTWVETAQAKPIAGALKYATYAAEKGVEVFYVSNRDKTYWQATVRNLKQLGFPVDGAGQRVLMRSGQGSESWDKTLRRSRIARQYRVVQIVGAGLDDFMGGTREMTLAEQRATSGQYMTYWGNQWFMLPNPAYGGWETAAGNFGSHKITRGSSTTPSLYTYTRGAESQGAW